MVDPATESPLLVTPASAGRARTVEQSSVRLLSERGPRRRIDLGYVDLAEDAPYPIEGKPYKLLPARDVRVGRVAVPNSAFMALDLDLYALFSGDLPDIFGGNEGLLKIATDTKDPQDLTTGKVPTAFATHFEVRDHDYAPTLLYHGVVRNVVFKDFVNLFVNLYEMDEDPAKYYGVVKGIIDGIPELKSMDVLNGIPYLNVATKLFDSVIRTFGKNPDDHLWGEIPILQITPTPGGAFLRSGIYVLFEPEQQGSQYRFEELVYQSGQVLLDSSSQALQSTHLIFGVALKEHQSTK